MNSGICDSIQTEHNIYHIVTVKSTASSTLILLRTHRQIADNHCRNRHLMQPLTSQPASTSVISINACRVNHYPASVKYINQSMCRANQRINVWVSGEVSLQMLQSGPTLQQTIQYTSIGRWLHRHWILDRCLFQMA